MNIGVFGTSHKFSEVSVREKMAFSNELLPAALEKLKSLTAIEEGFIISTCNRTEIYFTSENPTNAFKSVENFLTEGSGIPISGYRDKFYRQLNSDAIQHLFAVASGLDSMILGEPQILGQVKSAFRLSRETGSSGVILNRLLNQSFTVGKRVRSETALGAGAVSVAYAAVELAQKIFRDLKNKRALLIGAGKNGELTARHLYEKGIGELYITNRTFEKAHELATELQGKAIEFSEKNNFYSQVDIIIGAAAAPSYFIQHSDLIPVIEKKGSKPLFLVDIGIPRNFDPQINRFESVFLHDLDALQQITSQNLKKRRQEIPRAEKIIQEETERYLQWKNELRITPTIVSLRKKMEEIKNTELGKYRHKLSKSELESAELISRAIINKILHQPMTRLKKLSNGAPDALLRLDVVRDLFGLEEGK